jgi:hypothetical protein
MKNSILLTGIVVSVLFISSCTNDDLLPLPKYEPSTSYHSVADFHEKHGVPIHTYQFNAASGGTFSTPKGTIVEIPANAFLNSTGQPISGLVKLEIRDIYAKSDMVLSNVTTMSEEMPLVSGGEAWFRITQNGQAVWLNNANPVTVKMRQLFGGTPMDLYTGENDATGDGVNWVATGSPVQNGTFPDTAYFQFLLNEAIFEEVGGNWVNCDHPFANYTSTVLHLTLDGEYESSHAYLLVDLSNTCVSLSRNSNQIDYHYAPLGYAAHVVVIGIKGEKVFTAIEPITISENQTIQISPQETTVEEFKQLLQTLD